MTAEFFLFVGTLTRDVPSFEPARGCGIVTLSLDSRTGGLSRIAETSGIDNPTYLALDSANHFLYATSEVYEWHEGTVTAYRVDLASGLRVAIRAR
jgi:6-phosphogluconolactonase